MVLPREQRIGQQPSYPSVTIVGAAQDLTIDNNWSTTRPLSGFYTPDPTATGLATFRPV